MHNSRKIQTLERELREAKRELRQAGPEMYSGLEGMIQEIESLYADATGSWLGADWTHEQLYICDAPEHGSYVPCPQCEVVRDEHGEHVLCQGDQVDDCQTCKDAENAAAYAEELAEDAMQALRESDFSTAAGLAKDVYNLEDEFGDAPTWGDWAHAIEELADEADELLD